MRSAKHLITTNSPDDSEWKRIFIDDNITNYEMNRITTDIINIRTKNLLKKIIPKYDMERGYRVTLSIYGGPQNLFVHRIFAALFIPIPEEYLERGFTQRQLIACARDGNPYNINEENIFWYTKSEQMKDSIKSGKVKIGRNNVGKINEETAHEICKLLEKKVSVLEIKEKLNIPTTRIIYYIKNGITWKNISSQYKI